MLNGRELLAALEANYFEGEAFRVRTGIDASDFPWLLVLVYRKGSTARLFGLRFLDYPASPPTLRLWRCDRWNDAGFVFDFTSAGDDGAGLVQSPGGVATICIPFHVDYYKGGWHGDHPWLPDTADNCLAELLENILRRA